MKKLPTKKEIKKIHKDLAEGPHEEMLLKNVWGHSKIVAEIALQLAKRLEKEQPITVDKDFIKAGALLHDVGIYHYKFDPLNPGGKDLPYYKHAILGREIIEKLGLAQSIARLCEIHSGVGITKQDIQIQNLDLPLNNFVPITTEEELIVYADKFHPKTPRFITFEQTIDNLRVFGWRHAGTLAQYKAKFGLPNLNQLKEKYEEENKKIREYKEKIKEN